MGTETLVTMLSPDHCCWWPFAIKTRCRDTKRHLSITWRLNVFFSALWCNTSFTSSWWPGSIIPARMVTPLPSDPKGRRGEAQTPKVVTESIGKCNHFYLVPRGHNTIWPLISVVYASGGWQPTSSQGCPLQGMSLICLSLFTLRLSVSGWPQYVTGQWILCAHGPYFLFCRVIPLAWNNVYRIFCKWMK